ncbi:MAG: hypothetical protein IPO92_07635 [Saprospiraceae bacterium]|nr:hypothetical protein [Saprospiraceae bacterium]
MEGDNDSIYYSIIRSSDDKANKIIGALNKGGSVGQIMSYTTSAADGNSESHILTNFKKSLFSCHVGGKKTENEVVLARRRYNGKTMWSKLYNTAGAKRINASDIGLLTDSTFAIVGALDSTFYINVTDTTGTVKWSRKYRNTLAKAEFKDVKILSMKDSSIVISCNDNILNTSYIQKISKTGLPVWSKKLILNGLDSSLISDISIDKNNDILVAGVAFIDLDSSYNFVLKLASDGQVKWKNKYAKIDADFNSFGSVFGTKDGGSAFINSAREDNLLRPSFIRLDGIGSSSCEEKILEEVFVDNVILVDTLIWTSRAAGTQDSVKSKSNTNVYNVPVLKLNRKDFCPNEPIDFTFKSPVKGATNYEWSTGVSGPALDSLRVFEEGKYSLTVTVGEGVCFMLCDTAELARYKLPMAGLGLSIGNFCANNKMTISASYQPGHPNIKSIVWSSGESGVTSIEVAQPGTYSVTIVDQCNESDAADLNTGEFPKKITAATINGTVSFDCLVVR